MQRCAERVDLVENCHDLIVSSSIALADTKNKVILDLQKALPSDRIGVVPSRPRHGVTCPAPGPALETGGSGSHFTPDLRMKSSIDREGM